MPHKWKIKPINLGVMTVDKSNQGSLREAGQKAPVVIIAWLLTNGSDHILVDTGGSYPEWSAKYHNPMQQTAEQTLEKSLARNGLAPEDITTVINTHLHWDHCFQNHLFKNAVIYVQKEEFRYAVAPLPKDRRFYETDIGLPNFLKCYKNYYFIEGDTEIKPGIKAVFIPGHTPGMQGIAVETSQGTYFLTSDAVPLYESWEKEPFEPGRIYVNLFDVYRSVQRIKEIADFILPGHDLKVFQQERYPY